MKDQQKRGQAAKKPDQPPSIATNGRRAPSARDCRIYERYVLEGETQERLAAEYAVSRQRVAKIVAKVEGWIAGHPDHPLARGMRVRVARRYESLWNETMTGFQRSRADREVVVERALPGEPKAVVVERTVRQSPGDVRFLNVGVRVVDRQQRLWPRGEGGQEDNSDSRGRLFHNSEHNRGRLCDGGAAVRFPFLPAKLCDLADLARGYVPLPGPPPKRAGAHGPHTSPASSPEGEREQAARPAAMLFEERCADAFRSLGFVVRELGQGCGRTADCLALAPADRFGLILDAKARQNGYTLGTDDRQFCDYATRHGRELAASGIDRIYFVVIGSGFRRHDLENLAALMVAEPIRSVSFLETHALMRLVNDSIEHRDTFRLAELEAMFFGNKIIEE